MKHCNKCDTTKSNDSFGGDISNHDGKQLWCSLCTRAYYNQWRKENKGKASKSEKQSFKTFYSTIHGRAIHMNNNAKRRAKINKVDYDLDVSWIEERLNHGFCEVTGIAFVIKENQGKGHRVNSFSPSIDRIDQTGPYTQENCQMTCWIYNRAKGAFPLDDLYTMVKALI